MLSLSERTHFSIRVNHHLGYGFVEYEDVNDAEDAMKQCNGLSLQGERIVVEFAKGAARKRDDNTCFRCNQEGMTYSATTAIGF
ncbi:hypothetical protein LPJ56_003413 [Coemansia sp. RSA 2599]|nr:hypothetical protein LPJ75_004963 [Coemansia sp. RSA 2598]KAJ1820551.1 hypothetical protein LPJ56_003413 [Coemansia sp. RSA 2599]